MQRFASEVKATRPEKFRAICHERLCARMDLQLAGRSLCMRIQARGRFYQLLHHPSRANRLRGPSVRVLRAMDTMIKSAALSRLNLH